MPVVKLIEFDEEYLDATLHWMSDKDLRWGLLVDRKIAPDSHRLWFANCKADPSQAIYAIIADNTHVGNFGYRHINRQHGTGDLWMYLGSPYRGTGMAKPALRAGLDLGFGLLRLRKISLSVRFDNRRAVALYAHAGFVEEGLLRADQIYEGKPIDMIRMALFAHSER